jgi:hypothetical protein
VTVCTCAYTGQHNPTDKNFCKVHSGSYPCRVSGCVCQVYRPKQPPAYASDRVIWMACLCGHTGDEHFYHHEDA